MPKKKAKPMKTKTKSKKLHPELHHLTALLKYTERNITNDGSDLSEYFRKSAERIRERMRGIK
jgi:hypothetical protein